MTIKTITCYVVACNHCGEFFDGGNDYRPHFDSPQAALAELEDWDNWFVLRDGTVYCGALACDAAMPACSCPGDDPDCSSSCVPGCPCVRHERIEAEGPCPKCGEVFERQAQLNWHMYKHAEAERASAQPSNLEAQK